MVASPLDFWKVVLKSFIISNSSVTSSLLLLWKYFSEMAQDSSFAVVTLSEFLCWQATSVEDSCYRFRVSRKELNFFFGRGSLVEKHNVTIFLGTTDEDNEKLKVDVETVADQPFLLSEVIFFIVSFLRRFHPIRQKMDHVEYLIAVINVIYSGNLIFNFWIHQLIEYVLTSLTIWKKQYF